MNNKMDNKTFELVSTLTPIVNVDLIVKNKDTNKIILSWRDDSCGTGWHVPGRIIRFRESIKEAITLLFFDEFHIINDSLFEFNSIYEIFNENTDIRGHFISFLYLIDINDFKLINTVKKGKQGYLREFSKCPKNLIKYHEIYRDKINECF